MIPFKQLNDHKPEEGIKGDCFRTAIGCLVHIPPEGVPHFMADQPDYNSAIQATHDWLAERGYIMLSFPLNCNLDIVYRMMLENQPNTYYILEGSNDKGIGHVVICRGDKVIHNTGSTKITQPVLAEEDGEPIAYFVRIIHPFDARVAKQTLQHAAAAFKSENDPRIKGITKVLEEIYNEYSSKDGSYVSEQDARSFVDAAAAVPAPDTAAPRETEQFTQPVTTSALHVPDCLDSYVKFFGIKLDAADSTNLFVLEDNDSIIVARKFHDHFIGPFLRFYADGFVERGILWGGNFWEGIGPAEDEDQHQRD